MPELAYLALPTNNSARKINFDSIDCRRNSKNNGIVLVEIAKTFAVQEAFYFITVTFGWLDGRDNGVGLAEISKIFMMQETFFNQTRPFEYITVY